MKTMETTEEVSSNGMEKCVERRNWRQIAPCASEKPNLDRKKRLASLFGAGRESQKSPKRTTLVVGQKTNGKSQFMYVPKHFEESRVDVLHQLIRANPFGTLVGLTSGGLVANHIPFEIENVPAPFGMLQAHIARANTFWQECSPETEVLVIFQGPDAYISPGWYPAKKQHGKVVPTWNYTVVHAYGRVRFIDDSRWLRAFVEKLTNRHESGRVAPWKITDAPPDYIEKQLGAIVGLEISITRLVGKSKLGQNRSAEDQAGMVKGLLEQGGGSGADLAKLISERQPGQT